MRFLALTVIAFLCCLQLVAQDKERPKLEIEQQELSELLNTDSKEEKSTLLETETLPRLSQKATITESMLLDGDQEDGTTGEIDFTEFAKEWEGRGKQYTDSRAEESTTTDLTILAMAGSVVAEIIITAILLFAAFSIQGSQNTALSALGMGFIVGLSGLICEFALGLGVLNPLRFAIGGILLIPLILALTPIEKPLPAVLIAVPVRIISVAIVWVAALGLSTLMEV
ncbi:MAG: hypothetical protein ACSHYA_08160 [Opitutaceae bacterium]